MRMLACVLALSFTCLCSGEPPSIQGPAGFLKGLASKEGSVRKQATEWYWRGRHEQPGPEWPMSVAAHVQSLWNDADADHRSDLVWALRLVGGDERLELDERERAVRLVVLARHDAVTSVKEDVARSLGLLTDEEAVAERAVTVLLTMARTEQASAVLEKVLFALGNLREHAAAATPVFVEYLHADDRPGLRRAAARSLIAVNPKHEKALDAWRVLIDLLKPGREHFHRSGLLVSIKHLWQGSLNDLSNSNDFAELAIPALEKIEEESEATLEGPRIKRQAREALTAIRGDTSF